MNTKITLLVVLTCLFLFSSTTHAQTPTNSPKIERYITDDALGMVRINVSKFDIHPWIDLVKKAIASRLDEMANRDLETFRAAAAGVQLIAKGAGLSELYLVLDTNELYQKNLIYAVGFVAKDGRPEMLSQLMQLVGSQAGVKITMRRIDGAFVFGTPKTLDRIERGPAIARPELAGAMSVAKDSPLQFFYLPNRLHRRVIAELAPPLPKELGGASAGKIGSAVQWAALVADLAPAPTLRAIVQADSQQQSRQIHAIMEHAAQFGLAQLAQARGVTPEGKKAIARLKKFIPRLVPQFQGNRLVTTVNLTEDDDLLTELIASVIFAQRAATQRAQSINALRQLGLGMHNYHEVHKHLPAVANFDQEGRPLLSWRVVHVLPYLDDQIGLYKEFHLDEPWDSEHNKPLIKRMPKIFRSPGSRAPKGSGLTSYVVPVGQGTMFTGKEKGISLGEIVDGTSNTIMILQVADSQAVIWSKPDDWQLDLENLKQGLTDSGNDIFLAAFGDGSVQSLKIDIDPEILRRLLLREDRQPIPAEY